MGRSVARVVILCLLALLAGRLAPAEAGLRVRSGEMAARPAATRIAASQSHTCLVREDGTVACWGAGADGQLGDGGTSPSPTPVTVTGLTQAISVAAAAQSTCALTADGHAWCWGYKQGGPLGNGTSGFSRVPVHVSSLTHATALDTDWSHACAVRADGKPVCWGLNFSGQLGDGTTTTRNTPVFVSGLTDAVSIGTGGNHSCVLRATGSVACWGFSADGRLGNPQVSGDELSPVAVSGLSDAVALAVADGGKHNCALRADGTVVCWGANHAGQLGDGTGTTRNTPVPVSGLTGVVALAAGASQITGAAHTCALRADGTVLCWGANASGQLGDGTTTSRLTPVAVSGVTDVVAITAGWDHTCAMRVDGSAACWGRNTSGQLGDGTTTNSSTPRAVADVQGSISARGVWGGTLHTCAVRANGNVACWGSNRSGQLGDGATTTRLTPVTAGVGPATSLALGSEHTCALAANGTASCWGANESGQLGNGTVSPFPRPAGTVKSLTDAVALAAGAAHTCALRADGAVLCWGSNASGQLGDGTTESKPIPVHVVDPGTLVAPLNGIVALAAGAAHTCAVRVDGRTLCWGDNVSGQLGDGTRGRPRSIPTAVDVLSAVIAVTAGDAHTCALHANGTVSCWGSNVEGGLGNGTTTDALTGVPVKNVVRVLTSSIEQPIVRAVGVVAGRRHACALIADGSGRCWGHNVGGELGDGTIENRLLAVVVSDMSNAAGLATGVNHTCHVQADGQPFCWGHNEQGQIGDGTTVFPSVPVPLPSFLFNIAPVADLRAQGRIAEVDVLMNCPEREHAHVHVKLTQPHATGHGVGAGRCTGELSSYRVTVPALSRKPFEPGPADASLDAIVHDRGRVKNRQHWEEVIELAP